MSRMRCCQREGCDRSDQCCNSAEFGRQGSSFGSVLDSFPVRDVILIEHDDLAWNLCKLIDEIDQVNDFLKKKVEPFNSDYKLIN